MKLEDLPELKKELHEFPEYIPRDSFADIAEIKWQEGSYIETNFGSVLGKKGDYLLFFKDLVQESAWRNHVVFLELDKIIGYDSLYKK